MCQKYKANLRMIDYLENIYQSPSKISCLFLPSSDTQAEFLASGETIIWKEIHNLL